MQPPAGSPQNARGQLPLGRSPVLRTSGGLELLTSNARAHGASTPRAPARPLPDSRERPSLRPMQATPTDYDPEDGPSGSVMVGWGGISVFGIWPLRDCLSGGSILPLLVYLGSPRSRSSTLSDRKGPAEPTVNTIQGAPH